MNSKFTLALIALVGVGVFALPSTMALFAGQHSFYNIDATGNQIPCVKCHGDVKAELNSGYSSVTGTKGPHAEFKCEYCHRAEAGGAYGDNAYVREGYDNFSADGETVVSSVYLVTTILNNEAGNFPKVIIWPTSGTPTADDFANPSNGWFKNFACAKEGDKDCDNPGTPFILQTNLNNSDNQYAGKLSDPGTAGAGKIYYLKHKKEVPTYNQATGQPIDTNTATQNTAFNARNVTVDSGGNVSLNGAGSRTVTPGTRYHAASLVSCLECHGGDMAKGVPGYLIYDSEPYNHRDWLLDSTDPNSKCSNCHYGMDPAAADTVVDELQAGGFGLTGGKYAENDTGELEAHNDFVRAKGGVLRSGYGAANDACVACHTHVAVDINFQKKYALKFDADAFQGGNYTNGTGQARLGAWGVGGFSAQGTVDVEEYGNGTGGAFATGNHTYGNWTPGTTMYLVNGTDGTQGAQVLGLNNDKNDSSAALTT